jgi:hypothetical protein
MCIGEQFAWSEAATTPAELGRAWRIRVHNAPLAAGRSSATTGRWSGDGCATVRRAVDTALTLIPRMDRYGQVAVRAAS